MAKNQITETERWYCSQCNNHGTINYDRSSDIMSVAYLLEEGHHQMSPQCAQRPGLLEVLNEEHVKNMPQKERSETLKKFGLEDLH